MTQLRFKGPTLASSLGMVSAAVGGNSGSVSITSFKSPAAISGLPRVSSGQGDGDTLALDTTGLTNITAYDWRIVGGATLGTSSTLDSTGQGGNWVECEVTCDQGALVSPAVMVYSQGMMAGHNADDTAVVALVPHDEATHIAVADGNWTSAATWYGGKVPRDGAKVLIRHGRSGTYDNSELNVRLYWVRVDGALTWSLTKSTTMLVEHLVVTRMASMVIGTSSGRMPSAYTAEIIISGRDYSQGGYFDTDLKLSNDPRLWGRGVLAQGVCRIWGKEVLSWSRTTAGVESGATSLTLQKVPTGWSVGDTIIIAGTVASYAGVGNPMTHQDEERVITDITDNTITWSGGLTYPHKNQLAGSTRTDLYPAVLLKRGRNVILRSEEVDDIPRRGHFVCMHHHCTVDIWHAEFIELGRTDKTIPVATLDGDGDTRSYEPGSPYAFTKETTVARDNMASRYPLHMHHVGFAHTGARPIVRGCYVGGTPGWGMVHHSCDVDLIENAIYGFYGAGMVSEQGNELGAWVDNIAGGATTNDAYYTLSGNPKVRETTPGLYGDNFRFGYAFAMRGRAVRSNRNVAISSPWAHVFYPRNQGDSPSNYLFPALSLDRDVIDIKGVGRLRTGSSEDALGEFSVSTYPILHFSDNEAMGCLGGLTITKQNAIQDHDVNVHIKRFKAWGYSVTGADTEYVGTYILSHFDCTPATSTGTIGINFAGNSYQIILTGSRMEGNSVAIKHGAISADVTHDFFAAPDNPRWGNIGTDFVDNTAEETIVDTGGLTKTTLPEIRTRDDDYDGTAIDYDLAPSETFPLEVGVWDGASNTTFTSYVDNTDGYKVSNLTSSGEMAPKPYNDGIFLDESKNTAYHGTFALIYRNVTGYYSYDGAWAIVDSPIISDQLTGRPHKVTKMIRATSEPNGGTDNGAFTYTATPVVASDKTATVAVNGSVDINLLTGASGGDGSNYNVDALDHIAADHGVATFDFDTGVVTYEPDPDYTGTDEFYAFVHSAGQYCTVRVNVLIGAGGSVSTPVVDTHFTATDHADANTIGVQLLAPPTCGGRRIDLVQYSTDAGVTWRRLCNRWIQAVHKVTTESDGTAIANGAYNLRIRYKTDYDFTTSAESSDDAVTVA